MRRWLSIFLLVILPLQFSYAAAAAYCQHESQHESQPGKGRAAVHFGHHVHQHHDAAGSHEPAKGKFSMQLDQDCGFCHLSGLQSVLHRFELTLPAVLPTSPPVAMTTAFRSFDRSQIDRPNWVASL